MKKQFLTIFSVVLIGFSLFFMSYPVRAISEEITDPTPDPDMEEVMPNPDTVIKDSSEKVNEEPETKIEETKVPTDAKAEEPSPQTVVSVTTYDEFVDAMNNSAVTSITLGADINGMGGSTKRITPLSRDLIISGNNHKLNIGSQTIALTNLSLDTGSHTFQLMDVNINNNKYGEGFITVNTLGLGHWNLILAGITAEKGSVNRVAQAHRCAVTLKGTNNIDTTYENFELGSFTLANNSTYRGNNSGTDWSIIDYTVATLPTDTAANRNFTLEKGASADFTSTYSSNGQTGWPVLWGYYKSVTLEDNSTFKAKWGHDVFRGNADTALNYLGLPLGLTIRLKSGATMDIDNVNDHDLPAINMDAGANTVTLDPGATLKATSDGIYGAMAFDGGINKFYANQPKLVDLKNKRANYKAFLNTIGVGTDFTIENTDVSYWDTNVDDDANPTKSFTNVTKINSVPTNKWTSNPTDAATAMNAGKVQRFATRYVEKGGLSITEVPQNVSFGTNLVNPTTVKKFPIQNVTGSLKVTDTRAVKQNWELGVTVLKGMTGINTGYTLPDALYYKSTIGDFQLNNSSTIVEKHTNVDNDYSVSNNWGADAGLYLLIKDGARADTYASQIRWDIRDVPA